MEKKFSVGAIMSVIVERQLVKNINDMWELITFLTGRGVLIGDKEGMCLLFAAAQSQLFQQFPALSDGHTQFARGELILFLEMVSEKDTPNLILGWLSKQANRLGMDIHKGVIVREPSTKT